MSLRRASRAPESASCQSTIRRRCPRSCGRCSIARRSWPAGAKSASKKLYLATTTSLETAANAMGATPSQRPKKRHCEPATLHPKAPTRLSNSPTLPTAPRMPISTYFDRSSHSGFAFQTVTGFHPHIAHNKTTVNKQHSLFFIWCLNLGFQTPDSNTRFSLKMDSEL